MSEIELIKELNKRLKDKTRKEVAKELGISQSYLNDIIKGYRNIQRIAGKLGFEAVTTYKRIKSD
jgi:transcriptional regulator with XRE-family HTH domain